MQNVYRLANFSKTEIKLLNLIEKEAFLASEIGKNLSIPRATLDRMLAQLFARGFVSRKKRGKRFVYKSMSTEEVLLEYGLTPANIVSAGVSVHQGQEALLELTKKFIKLHAKRRVRVLQTKQTWDFWKTYLTKEQNLEVNTLLKREAVINEGIFSEALLKEGHKEFFATYSNRPSIVHVLPEEHAQFVTDITITDKELYIMSWKDGVGIEITNKDTVEAFNQIFDFINENTESTNIYELTK